MRSPGCFFKAFLELCLDHEKTNINNENIWKQLKYNKVAKSRNVFFFCENQSNIDFDHHPRQLPPEFKKKYRKRPTIAKIGPTSIKTIVNWRPSVIKKTVFDHYLEWWVEYWRSSTPCSRYSPPTTASAPEFAHACCCSNQRCCCPTGARLKGP